MAAHKHPAEENIQYIHPIALLQSAEQNFVYGW